MERQPFNPAEPFDAMAESFRIQVCDMMLEARKAAIFRDLDGRKQIGCFLAGALTGMIGVTFACINPEGRDAVMEMLAEFLPMARQNAEEIEANGLETEGSA